MPHLTNRFAEVLLHQSAFDSFGAAIAAIVATVFVVVLVVAVAVSPVIRQLAGQFAFALVVWVDALALESDLQCQYQWLRAGNREANNTHLS